MRHYPGYCNLNIIENGNGIRWYYEYLKWKLKDDEEPESEREKGWKRCVLVGMPLYRKWVRIHHCGFSRHVILKMLL